MRNIFKIASLLSAAVMLFSCGEKIEIADDIVLISDKDVIQSNGQDVATLKVLVGGKDVTADAVIYNEKLEVVNLPGGQFSATQNGEYKFWAAYGTMQTYNDAYYDNGLFTIKAISHPVPEAVEDPQPSNTSFEHRALLVQYTGTSCPNCPKMTRIVKDIMLEGVIPDKAIFTAVHSYKSDDPAYIPAPAVATYPYMKVDLSLGYSYANGKEALKSMINKSVAGPAKAGLAVTPMLYDDGTLVVKVSVKAAEDGVFNVGAWLLEDNIKGLQANNSQDKDPAYNTHNSCVRIADSNYKKEFFGFPLGTLKAGQTVQKTFIMNLKSKWEIENLHLAAFVSHANSRGDYSVCNAIDCPIDEPTPFDYK